MDAAEERLCGRCGGPLPEDHYFMGDDGVKECDSCVNPIFLAMRLARLDKEARADKHAWRRDRVGRRRGRDPYIPRD